MITHSFVFIYAMYMMLAVIFMYAGIFRVRLAEEK